MLHSTKGIVLHTVKYSETSLIVKIYTETFGLQSYMVKGIRKQKSKTKPAAFQHLSLVNLVVYHREKATLQSIREIQIAYPYSSLPFDIRKSSIALFITELLYKSIREEESNPKMFRFIWDSCVQLDFTEVQHHLFHLWFAVHLSAFLGFMPQGSEGAKRMFFNMKEGIFQVSRPDHEYFMDETLSDCFHKLIGLPDAGMTLPGISTEIRDLLLDRILVYYQLHLSGFRGLRSVQVLHTLLA
jgi:DNA repair protein RecO (recombination protein O)